MPLYTSFSEITFVPLTSLLAAITLIVDEEDEEMAADPDGGGDAVAIFAAPQDY